MDWHIYVNPFFLYYYFLIFQLLNVVFYVYKKWDFGY